MPDHGTMRLRAARSGAALLCVLSVISGGMVHADGPHLEIVAPGTPGHLTLRVENRTGASLPLALAVDIGDSLSYPAFTLHLESAARDVAIPLARPALASRPLGCILAPDAELVLSIDLAPFREAIAPTSGSQRVSIAYDSRRHARFAEDPKLCGGPPEQATLMTGWQGQVRSEVAIIDLP